MRVGYETNLDEIVDVQLRFLKRWRFIRPRRPSTIVAYLLIVLLIAMVILLSPSMIEAGEALLAAGMVGGVTWLLFPILFKRNERRRLATYYGTEQAIPFAVELREERIWTQMGTTEVARPWSSVVRVVEAPDAIELELRDGLILVRNKAFADWDERTRFLELARERVSHAKAMESRAEPV